MSGETDEHTPSVVVMAAGGVALGAPPMIAYNFLCLTENAFASPTLVTLETLIPLSYIAPRRVSWVAGRVRDAATNGKLQVVE